MCVLMKICVAAGVSQIEVSQIQIQSEQSTPAWLRSRLRSIYSILTWPDAPQLITTNNSQPLWTTLCHVPTKVHKTCLKVTCKTPPKLYFVAVVCMELRRELEDVDVGHELVVLLDDVMEHWYHADSQTFLSYSFHLTDSWKNFFTFFIVLFWRIRYNVSVQSWLNPFIYTVVYG